jgi:hypothetical protein
MSWHAIHPESFDPDCVGCLDGARLTPDRVARHQSRTLAAACLLLLGLGVVIVILGRTA